MNGAGAGAGGGMGAGGMGSGGGMSPGGMSGGPSGGPTGGAGGGANPMTGGANPMGGNDAMGGEGQLGGQSENPMGGGMENIMGGENINGETSEDQSQVGQAMNQATGVLDKGVDEMLGDDSGPRAAIGEQVSDPKGTSQGGEEAPQSDLKPGDDAGPGREVGEDGKVKETSTQRLQNIAAQGVAAYFSEGDPQAMQAAKDLSQSKTGGRIADTLEKTPGVKQAADIAEETGVTDVAEGALEGYQAYKNGDYQAMAEAGKKVLKGDAKNRKYRILLAILPFTPLILAVFFVIIICGPTLGGFMDTTETYESQESSENQYYENTGGEPGVNGNEDIGTITSLLEIPYFYQGSYSNVRFGGNSIATSGCSVTSLAMVISYLKRPVTPPDVVQEIANHNNGNYNKYYVEGKGQSWSIFPAVASYYGMTSTSISLNSIDDALAENKPVIASCGCCTFTKGGHFIVIKGYDADTGLYYVNDPNHPSFGSTGYDISVFRNECKGYWSFS